MTGNDGPRDTRSVKPDDPGKKGKKNNNNNDPADSGSTGKTTKSNDSPASTPAAGAPVISGEPRVGEALAADTAGKSDDDGISKAVCNYQWLADYVAIDGATASTYILVPGDEGKSLKVRVNFTDDAGSEKSLAEEAMAGGQAWSNSPATGLPTIMGTALVGQILAANTFGIGDADEPDKVSLKYRWIVRGRDIDGATSSTYGPSMLEVGQTFQLWVTFTDDACNHESLTYAVTEAVVSVPLTAGLESETRNIHWRITVRPDGSGDVSIVLPATTGCGATGLMHQRRQEALQSARTRRQRTGRVGSIGSWPDAPKKAKLERGMRANRSPTFGGLSLYRLRQFTGSNPSLWVAQWMHKRTNTC